MFGEVSSPSYGELGSWQLPRNFWSLHLKDHLFQLLIFLNFDEFQNRSLCKRTILLTRWRYRAFASQQSSGNLNCVWGPPTCDSSVSSFCTAPTSEYTLDKQQSSMVVFTCWMNPALFRVINWLVLACFKTAFGNLSNFDHRWIHFNLSSMAAPQLHSSGTNIFNNLTDAILVSFEMRIC